MTRDCMWFFECYPRGPSANTFYLNCCFPENTVEQPDFDQIVAYYYTRWDTVLAEDIKILERQHKGVGSPLACPGPVFHLESAVARFEYWLTGQIVASTGANPPVP